MTKFPFQKMDAYRNAKALAVEVRDLRIRHKELRDQAERAAVSVFLQLSEGLPNDSPAMRRRYFTIARNSLAEVAAAIDLAETLGVAEPTDAMQDRVGKLRAMLIGLAR